MVAPSRKDPGHFFWDGNLHKVLRVVKPANLVEAWCYEDRKIVDLLYSDYRHNAKIAVQSGRAAEIMHVSARSMKRYIAMERIHPPARAYALDGRFGAYPPDATWYDVKSKFWWGEHNLIELHEYLSTVSRGYKRLDGRPSPMSKLATKAEIRAAFNNSTMLYVKGTKGDYVPVFNQPDWK